MSHIVETKCDHDKTKRESIASCSTSIFWDVSRSRVRVDLGFLLWFRWRSNGHDNTNTAFGEKCEEDVLDGSSEDELHRVQKKWSPLLELCLHYTEGFVLVETMGVESANARVGNVHVRHVHRTRGSRVPGQSF